MPTIPAPATRPETPDVRALRDAGLRVTAPRLAVLAAVSQHPHADADTVLSVARAQLGSVSVQAVYDVLHALTRAGLLNQIEPAGHPARFERRVGDNHHHVVCRTCGAVADVDCATGHAPCLIPANDHGFSIETAEVLYWGTCPGCRAAATSSAT
ncbi:transcriptional repressor [Flavimobilis marinus]|uniref:Fur family transcriptional regulator, ferric uptake regulator n=1 Tax=Flavimobilis marinus TaxID=285351 RepID=A0A1I2EC48_9MICO|nr:Fur family transcriptional regulator [Flavimobilis marinus]GHG43190.1 transcriptional repressor [Flavimobilis marinus]SFE90166.1 Fur family transcriptional regulator, ferric uptake regulator [Flavimobilis marinus]